VDVGECKAGPYSSVYSHHVTRACPVLLCDLPLSVHLFMFADGGVLKAGKGLDIATFLLFLPLACLVLFLSCQISDVVPALFSALKTYCQRPVKR
jgi:hypothetical protein